MAQALCYAASVPWYRKRRWLPLLTLPILIVGYTLALPQFRTLRQHRIRRTEIRQQFKIELDNARRALDEAQLDSAAIALLNAEFPVRTEQQLFWPSEVESCKKQLKPLRAHLRELSLIAEAQAERREAEAQARLKQEMEEEARQGTIVRRCIFTCSRYGTIETLSVCAAQQLRKGNNKTALPICIQLVQLEPDHEFTDQFWANALPKP
jgi:hypothetical protein